MAQAAQGLVGSPSLKVFQNHGNVALSDLGNGYGGGGLMVDGIILVVFSNPNDSLVFKGISYLRLTLEGMLSPIWSSTLV